RVAGPAVEVPDKRAHRGPHPKDADLFASANVPALRQATEEMSWLASRGYAGTASLKLVGDRHALTLRQREAVSRCACADSAVSSRLARRVELPAVSGRALALD